MRPSKGIHMAASSFAARRPRARIRWDRVGRIALLCVLAFIVYLYVGPARSWITAYGEAKERRQQVADLRARHADLRAQEQRLRRSSALEREARRLGMVKAGERVYGVQGLPKQLRRSELRRAGLPKSPRVGAGWVAWLAVPYETAFDQWEAGARRLAQAPAEERPALERVSSAIEAELRRRLGGAFTSDELADLYDAGTGWCSDVALAVAPEQPFAWDLRVVADSAFARYLRGAVDFAGGRRLG